MIAEELLQNKKIKYRISGQDAVISCLNPEHDDSNPSMRVDKVTGIFNCFSCGYKGNLFTYFGAPASPLEVRTHRIREKINKVKSETVGIQLPKDRVPWKGGGIRNISEETLAIWGAFTWNVPNFENRIIFPIRDVRGKTVALIGRSLDDFNMNKYFIYPNGAEMPFCPAKVKPVQNRVILVEGIFDALNLWDKGLKNTVCCFGTQQVNWVKLSLLKLQGVSGVDIMFDGDEAGIKAGEMAKGLAEQLEMSARVVKLRDNIDPGNLTKPEIERLKEKLYG
jgi:DNA primase